MQAEDEGRIGRGRGHGCTRAIARLSPEHSLVFHRLHGYAGRSAAIRRSHAAQPASVCRTDAHKTRSGKTCQNPVGQLGGSGGIFVKIYLAPLGRGRKRACLNHRAQFGERTEDREGQ
jgi:hypothetical protein